MNRSEYLKKSSEACANGEDPFIPFREYYSQYVTAEILSAVARRFPLNQLRKAFEKDPHLNSIPLPLWDMGYLTRPLVNLCKEYGEGGWTMCFNVCVLKEAARQRVEGNLTETPDFHVGN